MTMGTSDWNEQNNITEGEGVKEMAGEDTENIVYMFVKIPENQGTLLARMAINKKVKSLRHEGKMGIWKRRINNSKRPQTLSRSFWEESSTMEQWFMRYIKEQLLNDISQSQCLCEFLA